MSIENKARIAAGFALAASIAGCSFSKQEDTGIITNEKGIFTTAKNGCLIVDSGNTFKDTASSVGTNPVKIYLGDTLIGEVNKEDFSNEMLNLLPQDYTVVCPEN